MIVSSDRFLKTILREHVDAAPVWIMRQAGRYLPEYRALRERAGSFMRLCQTPEWAAEVTLQPLRRFPLDASIIFSDILVIPDAMGLQLNFIEGEGPVFNRPIQSTRDVEALTVPDPEAHLGYVYDAVRMAANELHGKLPLIGFAGSPWTLAAYMVEGRSVPQFPTLMKWKQNEPETLHRLLALLSEAVFLHLRAQKKAGASALMIFDTWGGLLETKTFSEFSLHYMERVVTRLKNDPDTQKTPVILFTKGGGEWLEQIADSGCDVVGVDAFTDLKKAKERVGKRVALQGNLAPEVLLSSAENIRKHVKNMCAVYGEESGYVFNLGHGVTPDVPPEHVSILVDAVHEYSRR